ncbi:maleylpyruvate isomerase family mycothiol-dependent enzyme [Kitasatospora azatica]|uniref:maleylpyruvate isomerase family mycothiol-dependent enzyme n=1 Tax=Kitasatospora azatica TaxID=58347 RepID=UPI000565F400|nr:maleylpyruvate isomerase family mycothiol-dependent enzyme [Kitasatospora azatica]
MEARSDTWSLIHAERRALLADVQQLAPQQWTVFSLCAGRTVRDVLAHMAATARMTPRDFFVKMAKARFNFQTMTDREIHELTRGRPVGTVAAFAELVDATDHPPGPVESWLGETVVHAEDIRRPLGIAHDYPTEALVRCADFYRLSNLLIGGKKRVAGLSLRATDADWSAGEGPEAAGPMLELLLAITGRPAGLAALTGEGVETLTERIPHR